MGTYAAIHQRLQRLPRGACSCGKPAEEWALRHEAEASVDERSGLRFSMNLDDYMALCRACHRRYDGNIQKAWDRDHAGRASKQVFGEEHGRVKLSAEQVVEIRRKRATGMVLRELSAEYGVSMAQISRIALGQSWRR